MKILSEEGASRYGALRIFDVTELLGYEDTLSLTWRAPKWPTVHLLRGVHSRHRLLRH